MIKLFTKNNCPQCVEVKRALENTGLNFEMQNISTLPGMKTLETELAELDVDIRSIKSAPVMIAAGQSWYGPDCLVAIEEGELA